jgi:hypothetical protein
MTIRQIVRKREGGAVAFTPDDLAAAYALNVQPKTQLHPVAGLGLYVTRPYREYRIFQVSPPPPPSPQLSLFPIQGAR